MRVLAPAVFLAAVIAAVFLASPKPQARTGGDTPARAVTVREARLGEHSPVLTVYARVTASDHARLSAALSADVRAIKARAGETARRGDVLIALDDREAALAAQQRRADVLAAGAAVDAELLRHENELFVIKDDSGAAARQNRAKIIKGHEITMRGLEAQKLRAEAALRLAELDVQRAAVTAPFDGRVTMVHVSVGDRVRVGDRLIDLFDPRALELTGNIPRRYLSVIAAALADGERLVAESADNDIRLQAVLSRLHSEVNAATGAVDAVFTIIQGDGDRANHNIKLGRSLRLRLQLPSVADSFVLPNTALYGAETVYRVVGDDNDRRLQAVKVRRLGDYWAGGRADTDGAVDSASDALQEAASHVLVTGDDIRDGDIIITTQLPNAIENLAVRPVPAAVRIDAAPNTYTDRG